MEKKSDREVRKRFGERLKELRNARGISQMNLGLECDLSQTYLSEVEAGKRNISLANMARLARALQITLAHLLEGVE